MCFSAGASFAGGAVISAVGVAALRKANRPEQKAFAAMPLVFGLQQIAEGILWVTVRSGGHAYLQNFAAHIYLTAALVIWPVGVPLAMYLMEKVKNRKRILAGLIAAGGAVSMYYAFFLVSYEVAPQIQALHIIYNNNFPQTLGDVSFPLYLISTILPLFVSSIRRMWLLGTMIAVSFLISVIFFTQYLTSVWCFFAALISVTIFWILTESPVPTSQSTTAQ
jgi:hypothetical protein